MRKSIGRKLVKWAEIFGIAFVGTGLLGLATTLVGGLRGMSTLFVVSAWAYVFSMVVYVSLKLAMWLYEEPKEAASQTPSPERSRLEVKEPPSPLDDFTGMVVEDILWHWPWDRPFPRDATGIRYHIGAITAVCPHGGHAELERWIAGAMQDDGRVTKTGYRCPVCDFKVILGGSRADIDGRVRGQIAAEAMRLLRGE